MRAKPLALLLLGLLAPALLARAADPPADPKAAGQFGESISVGLATVRARIVDASGAPILGLKPEEVRVAIDRRAVPTVAVDYYDGSVSAAALPDERVLPAQKGAPHIPQEVSARGQLFAFFVETDADAREIEPPEKTEYLKRLVEGLKPDDLAAVVSLDARAKLQLDLTRDREAIYRALVRAGQGGKPAGLFPPGRLTLARFWNEAKAKTTTRTEEALQWLAAYLDRLPGEKVVVYLAQGRAHFSIPPGKGSPRLSAELWGAVRGLLRARAAVFVLDEPRSPATPVAVYLRTLAGSTGGAYLSTAPSRDEAADRLARSTRGYYLITFNMEQLKNLAMTAPLTVELAGRPGTVLVPPLQVVNLRP